MAEMATAVHFTVWLKEHTPFTKVSKPKQWMLTHQVPIKYPLSTHQVSHHVKEILLRLEGEIVGESYQSYQETIWFKSGLHRLFNEQRSPANHGSG